MLPTNTVSQALSTKEGESLVHFTVCDVKGRCNLIIWRWTKPDTHTRSSVSAHKTITVLFLSSYQQYFHTQDWLTSWVSVNNSVNNDSSLQHITHHKMSFQSAYQVSSLTHWIYSTAVVTTCFHAIIAVCALVVHVCPCAISCLPRVYPWGHTHDNMWMERG